jgi:hypothetical protein
LGSASIVLNALRAPPKSAFALKNQANTEV